MENRSETFISRHRILLGLIAAILLGTAVICIGLSMRLRAPEQSEICGLDTSDMLLKDAQKLLEEKVSGYSMHLTVGDQVFDITADDLGLVFLKEEFEGVVQAMADTGAAADPWSVIALDQEKLTSYFKENFDQKRTSSVPATVVWDDADGHFKVISGAPESWYDSELLADMVKDAVANLSTNFEVSENLLYTEVYDYEQQANVEIMAEKANELMELELEYVFNPRKVELGRHVIDGAMIASFLRFDNENDVIYVDENAVSTYVESIASDYSYFKKEDRFVTHGGDRVDIKITFQEQTVDTQALTGLIVENITAGVSGSYEVPYSGYVNFEGDYIEVSIPEQHLWVYQDGVVVLESDVVTGNESRNKRTPRGLNMVRGHLRQIYLMDAYFVEYWMCITMHGQYGFHDADGWREPDEYGGDTYKTNGSGGCVNVPLENMAKMYELVPDGTPVVIYDEYYYD